MKKIFLIAILITSFISCKNDKKSESIEVQKTDVSNENKVEDKTAFKKTQNYAVVFKWTTDDEKLVEENAMQQADQLLELWKNNTVENVYYDSDAKVDKFSYFPNITFVVKGENLEAVEVILNNLIVVKKGIATYTTYPVGTLWLKRNSEKINEVGITKSYVSVWSTDYKPEDTMIKAQNDVILNLWEEGKIENVYFDIEGTQEANNKTDFVFFVNANTEKEAKEILDKLPFVRNAVASYKLHQVGVFWMGINE